MSSAVSNPPKPLTASSSTDVSALMAELAAMRSKIESLEAAKPMAQITRNETFVITEEEKRFLQMSAQEKSQLNADKAFADDAKLPGIKRFKVTIAEKNGHSPHPILDLPGYSPEDAKGRYQRLCGILAVEGDSSWQVTAV